MLFISLISVLLPFCLYFGYNIGIGRFVKQFPNLFFFMSILAILCFLFFSYTSYDPLSNSKKGILKFLIYRLIWGRTAVFKIQNLSIHKHGLVFLHLYISYCLLVKSYNFFINLSYIFAALIAYKFLLLI